MITNIFKGLSFVFVGFSLLTKKSIRPFVFVPLAINVFVFSFAVWFSTNQFESWIDKLLPSWLSWLEWLLWPIFAVVFFFVIFYTFAIIANLIAAPFNSLLAERVENQLKGLPVPEFQGYKSLPSLVARTFKSEAAKLFYMLKWFVALLIISFIPAINIISPIAWMIFGAWMLAIQYADYPMGNHDIFFKGELNILKKHRSLALGFGGAMTVLTSIPFINFLAMPVGVAGGTALWVKQLSNNQ